MTIEVTTRGTKLGRIATLDPLDPQHPSEEIRTALERSPDLHLRGVMSQAEGVFTPWVTFSTALLSKLELSPLLRELAILQVAVLEVGGDYVWSEHASAALAAGATEAQLQALGKGAAWESDLREKEVRVLRFTREVVRGGRASVQAQAALRDLLGPRQVIELLLVIGHYMMIARIAAAADFGSELPARVLGRRALVKPVDARVIAKGYAETYTDAPDEIVNQDAAIPSGDCYGAPSQPGAQSPDSTVDEFRRERRRITPRR
jgi:4-carboxymuconolactone decarboxylase